MSLLKDTVEVSRCMPQTTEQHAKTLNIKIENCIGFTQVPLGIAGPLTIRGENQAKTVYAPLATYEPTLVASCSRGAKALQASGGVNAAALNEGMSRAPAFLFATVNEALRFYRHVPTLLPSLRQSAEATSNYAKLLEVTPHVIGTTVHVKFRYACGDAAGQNMVTIATHKACKDFLESPQSAAFNIIDFHLEQQFASDKKMSWGNVKDPRGVEVVAWATLTDANSRKVLGNSTKRLHEIFTKSTHATIRNGQLGNNINTANVMAAMFIATGQDPASVAESGWSQLTTELDEMTQDLTLSLYFPCILLGSVGGGTAYGTQKEALDLIDCRGAGRKWALAETIASFALALDISTLSAIANDTFSASHQNLARGGPPPSTAASVPSATLSREVAGRPAQLSAKL